MILAYTGNAALVAKLEEEMKSVIEMYNNEVCTKCKQRRLIKIGT